MLDPRAELADPTTTAARLAEIAQQHPELGPQIAAHPNAYPELQAWIAQYATPAPAAPAEVVQEAQAPVQDAQTAQQPQTGQQSGQPAYPAQPGYPAQPAYPSQPAQGRPMAYDPMQTPQAQAQARPQGTGGPAAPKKRMSRKAITFTVVGAVLLALLTGGGIAWGIIASKIGGSATPEASATKLVTSLAQADSLSIYGALAPSEFKLFEPSAKKLSEVTVKGSEHSAEQMLSELRGAVTVTTKDLKTETDSIAEGVERVTFTDGTITFSGDEDKVVDIVMGYAEESFGDTLSEEQLREAEEDLRDSLDLPYTVDFRELSSEMRGSGLDGVSLVSVQEGGKWFVSPLMTYADYIYLSFANNSDGGAAKLGDRVVDGKPSKSPEDAAKDLTKAVVDGVNDGFRDRADVTAIAERLPLAERRLLSIYGTETLPMMASGNPLGDGALKVIEDSFSSEQKDGQARITIEKLALGVVSEDQGEQLFNGVTITGLCAETRSEWMAPDYGSFDFSDGDSSVKYEKQDSTSSGCLDDSRIAKDLGLDGVDLIALGEDGGWFVSPLGTLADAMSIVTDRVVELAEDGRLEDTFSADNY